MCRRCRLRTPPRRLPAKNLGRRIHRTSKTGESMEIEVELQEGLVVEAIDSEGLTAGLASTLERLASAAGVLEQAVERIVAAGESKHEAELEQKLAAALAEVAELRASGAAPGTGTAKVTNGRKTLPVAMVSL